MTVYLLIAILFSSIYIGVELFYKPLFAFFFKALASMSFIVLGSVSVAIFRGGPTLLILFGLLFGMVGDLILALRPLRPKEEDHTIILAGIISFSLGHIFYLLFLLEVSRFSFYSILFSIGMTVIVMVVSYAMKFQMGKTKIPSYIYSFLIFLMVGQTIVYYLQQGNRPNVIMILIGAFLFGISDLILAPIYYNHMNHKAMIASNLITYYAAQILIAYSIFFL